MKKILPLLLLLFATQSIIAQPSITHNAGKDFYLTSFVNDQWIERPNYDTSHHDYYNDAFPDTAIIFVIGKYACNGYIENPQTGYREDFTVEPFVVAEIRVPENQIMCNHITHSQPVVQNKGIFLHAEEDVYVYLQSNFNYYDYGGRRDSVFYFAKAQVLPATNFSDEVSVPTSMVRSAGTKFYLIAMEDGTEIDIFLDNQSLPEFSVFLNRGEVYIFDTRCWQCKTNMRSNCKPFVAHSIFDNRSYAGASFYASDATCKIFPYPYPGKDIIYFLRGNEFYQIFQNSTMELFPNFSYTFNYCNIPLTIDTDNNIITIARSPMWNDILHLPSHAYLLSSHSLNPHTVGRTFTEAHWNRDGTVTHPDPYNDFFQWLPADQMVREAMFCCKTHQLVYSDSVEFTVMLVITPQDTNSTYLNGELINPATFSTLPGIEDRYYFTDFKLRDHIPDILHFENSNGLKVEVREEAFRFRMKTSVYLDFPVMARNQFQMNCRHHSGGNPQVRASLDEIAMSPVFCLGDTLMLRAIYNHENYPIDWIIDDVEYENLQEVRFPIPNLPGDSLLVTMIIHKRCPDTVSQMVYIDLPPVIANLPQDTMICRGAAIILQAENANLIRWSDGTEGSTLTAAEAGTYYVTASNDCHITATDSIRIAFFPEMNVDLGNDTLLCQLATLLLDASHPHATGYQWQDASTLATYTVRYDGDYWVVVTDPCGVVADSINVGYLLPVSVNLGNDTTLCNGDEILLLVDNPYCDYVWQDGSISNSFTVTHEGIYSVTATNLCYAGSDEIAVHFENCQTNPVYVPNAVSPDGNGVNDLFLPVFEMPDKLASYEMLIYNRWGTLLFQTRDPLQGWDAANAPVGSYVYFIRYKSESIAEKMVKGTVTVVR